MQYFVIFEIVQKDRGCPFRGNRHENGRVFYPQRVVAGNIIKKKLQGNSCFKPADDFRTSFSPCGHGDREEPGRKQGKPASVLDLEEIGRLAGAGFKPP